VKQREKEKKKQAQHITIGVTINYNVLLYSVWYVDVGFVVWV
jgi:nitrate/nitrite transporter NarK